MALKTFYKNKWLQYQYCLKEQYDGLLTLNAWSPHFSNALSPWFVMWFSKRVRSCPSPSGILATKLYMRPRSGGNNIR